MRGHVDIVSHNLIAGWAADPANPSKEVAVRVTVDGRSVRVIANQFRESLKSDFEGATGNYEFRLTEQLLPMSPFKDHEIAVYFAGSEILLPGGKVHLPTLGTPLPSEHKDGGLTPIVITSTGRAGTSLLMGRLGRHPNILVAREHPHELMLLGYYVSAFRALTAEADHKRSTNHENMLAPGRRFFTGSNPYHDPVDERDPLLKSFWNETVPDSLRDCFSALVCDYYRRLAERQAKPGARYFAEKISSSDLAREGTAHFFGEVREIVLVRDPRDVVCSSKSFWKRDFAASIGIIRAQLMNMARPRVEPGLRQLILRYEDLILLAEETMARVFEFLDLQQTSIEHDQEKESRIFQFHGTSSSQEATIGRWKREMTTEEADLVNSELAKVIEHFGY